MDRKKMNSVCDLSRDLNISNAIYFEGATMVGNIVRVLLIFIWIKIYSHKGGIECSALKTRYLMKKVLCQILNILHCVQYNTS